MTEERKDVRFEEIARVEAPALCSLPGVLEDISQSGCRVRFPVPVEIESEDESEYELKIYPSRQGSAEIDLLCLPCWVKNDSRGDEYSLGFKILHSPGTKQLEDYINTLKAANANDDFISEFDIEKTDCSFI